MAKRRRIDARCDEGGDLLDERAGLERDAGERPDVSRAQGFTRGAGVGQHHRALPRFACIRGPEGNREPRSNPVDPELAPG